MVFIARFNDYPLDVAHHGEAERIWIISREVWIVVRGLEQRRYDTKKLPLSWHEPPRQLF